MRRILLACLILCTCRFIAAQAMLLVPSTTHPTIQSAIDAAVTGDSILVAPGSYFESLTFPAVDFVLTGAGIGQSIIDGSSLDRCLTFTNQVSNAMVVDGFSLRNGNGNSNSPAVQGGGGIYINSSFGFSGPIEPTIRNCEITASSASIGDAIYFDSAGSVKIENCRIHSNGDAMSTRIVHVMSTLGTVAFENCVFENHGDVNGGPWYLVWIDSSPVSFRHCRFENNYSSICPGVFVGSSNTNTPSGLELQSCSFVNNIGTGFLSIAKILQMGVSLDGLIDNCLFANNSNIEYVIDMGTGLKTIRNCTFADNQMSSPPTFTPGVVRFGFLNSATPPLLRYENTIVYGNTNPDGSVAELGTALTNVLGVNSLIEGPFNAGTFTSPTFLDRASSNYRLSPGSLGVDGGTTLGLLPPPINLASATDIDGKPRVSYSAIDIGCYEGEHIAYSASSVGSVGATAGGPFNVLRINGSRGGNLRTVTVPLGSSSILKMNQPPNLAAPAGFAIFGLLGEATKANITNVPLGIGPMTFPPCPLFPTSAVLFTLTNNLGSFCPQFLASTATPWVSNPFPPINFPLTLTFQGVVEESPGVYVPTNMVIFKVQ